MSGNYDHPPASSRRPARPSDPEPPNPESLPQRVQRLIDTIDARIERERVETEAESESEQDILHSLRNNLHHIVDDRAPIRLPSSLVVNTPREGQLSTARHPRDRLPYLRGLIHSESNHSNLDETSRALQALNQEIDVHRLDQSREIDVHQLDEIRDRNRAHFDQARAAVEQQLQHLGSEASGPSRRYPRLRAIFDRYPPGQLSPSNSTPTSSNQEPRSSNRLTRRRSFRPDLLGSFNEPIPTPSLMPQPPQHRDSRDGRARLKRRKLDTDDNREGTRGFNYGQYGQVVPGALKMEIASCDGGIYDPDGDCSFPENILRNDNSVYCTKADRCNLVLRHQGEAPFCLKKLVIKGPRNGYDAAIQEGMVFVSMTSDDLLHRTAQYQIQYSSVHRRQHRRRTRALPSQEYLNSYRPPLESVERTVLMGPDSQSSTDNESADRNAPDPQFEFRVTTDYNEIPEDSVFLENEDSENPSVAEVERVLQEEEPPCSDSEESISEDDDDDEEEGEGEEDEEGEEEEDPYHLDTNLFSRRRRQIRQRMRRERLERRGWSGTEARRQGQPSLIDPIPPPPGGTSGASGSEVMKPHARFFIEREKSMVSIKFDPPPSGRFILIKLWSPRTAGNIDIQSIIAHGYAGPRFFPSGGFR